jgi:hypothetical protein
MRAASRALAVLLTVVALSAPADAQAAGPQCPAAVGELPLSFSTPFSGTVRPVADADGRITSTSLLCAYGEGVEPSAEVFLTWEADTACGTTETEVAAGVERGPFDALADDLSGSVGGACPLAESSTFPVVPVVAGGAAVLLLGLVVVRRRRRRPVPVAEPIVDAEPEPEPHPDLAPVLAQLSTRHGRVLARSETGQWLAVTAVAHAVDRPDAADLARAGSRPGRRLARPELAAVAEGLAHQATGVDR